MFFRTACLAAALVLCTLPAAAQSSLGVTASEFTLGTGAGPGLAGGHAQVRADTAITEFHGLQLDFAAERLDAGGLGHVAAHLYMTPHQGQKYGLFAAVSDLDGASFTAGLIGLEGRFALGRRAAFELNAGLGLAHRITAPERMDFLFVGGAVDYAASDRLSLGATAGLAEFEELNLQAVGYALGLEARWSPRPSPWSVGAGIAVTGLIGRDSAPAETVARIGLSYRFGSPGPDRARGFLHRADPYAPMALRGRF